MAKKEKTQLIETKGTFRARGIITRIGNEGAYREGTFDKGKNKGKDYRSIKFGLKTSPTNEIFVELFAQEREHVYAFKKLSKEEREKNKGKKAPTKKIPFEDRDNIPNGYQLIGMSIGEPVQDEEDDKKTTTEYETFVEFDAVDEIFQRFEDGDSVNVSGSIRLSEYENQQGQVVKQIQYNIERISRLTYDIDFEDEKFKEVCSFEQQFVFVDKLYDKDSKKLTVIGRTINWDGSAYHDHPFVIDASNEEVKDIFNGFYKKMKFGDLVTVVGLCKNEAQTVEVEDDIFGGGGSVPTGQAKANGKRLHELSITGIAIDKESKKLKYELKKYTLEDFVIEKKDKQEVIEDDDEEEDDNPFAPAESDDDDDLPFN